MTLPGGGGFAVVLQFGWDQQCGGNGGAVEHDGRRAVRGAPIDIRPRGKLDFAQAQVRMSFRIPISGIQSISYIPQLSR